MPRATPRACRTPGCKGTTTHGTLCEVCETLHRNAYDDERPNANERGYSRRWQSYTDRYLAAHPDCDGRLKYIDAAGNEQQFDLHPGELRPATEVDHIKPTRTALDGMPLNAPVKPKAYHKLFWDPKNHQGACKSCHSHKTATIDSRFASKSHTASDIPRREGRGDQILAAAADADRALPQISISTKSGIDDAMGRTPLPSAVHELTGAFKKNPQRGRARTDEPIPTGPLGEAPLDFTATQLAAWNEIVGNAAPNVLTNADRIAVELAARILAKVRHPAQGEEVKVGELNFIMSCLSRMGMTPADRAKISVPKPNESDNFFADLAADNAKQRPAN